MQLFTSCKVTVWNFAQRRKGVFVGVAKSPLHDRMGQTIKQARMAKGMDQQTLADQMGVTRQAVSRWEHGAVWPQDRQRFQLQKLLHVDVPSEPDTMPPVETLPASHAAGIRYACATIAQTVADLYRIAAEAERVAGLAAQDAALVAKAAALIPPATAASAPASKTATRRQRRG